MLNIVYIDTIDSTNNWCRAHESELPVVVVANEQTAGRGRYGKTFYSPAGSGVYMSYAFRAAYNATDVQLITLAAAATVHRVLQHHCSDELSIKWVNDIYRNGRKISGILCERIDATDGSGDYYIIIGVGVNVTPCEVPAELDGIVGFLCDEASADVRPSSLATEIAVSLDEIFCDCPSDIDDLEEHIAYYKSRCYNLPDNTDI